MPLLDISKVSETLKTLVENHVKASLTVLDPVGGTDAEISLDPPDQVNGKGNGPGTVSLYLYHLTENPHYKNLAAPGRDQPPIRYTPMGLNLFYQVTAHADTTAKEQRLMGLAVKALRDYPVIDDTTDIGGLDILSGDLQNRDNRIRIELQPIPHNEAISYWTAGSSPLRLAAYYQVSVALLEPEETQIRTGRVLSYGVHAFVSGSPRLDYSTNVLSFDYPGGTEPRRLELRPAQVPLDGEVMFVGSDLAGDRTELILRGPFWDGDGKAETGWDVGVSGDRVNATIRGSVTTETGTEHVWPGFYSAFARRTSRRVLPDGSVREFEHSSNRTPFVVTPRIDGITEADPTNPAGIVTVTLWFLNGYDAASNPADPAENVDIQIYLGNSRLDRIPLGMPAVGQFVVDDERTLRFVRPTEVQAESGKNFPLRIFANGAESPPHWVETPS